MAANGACARHPPERIRATSRPSAAAASADVEPGADSLVPATSARARWLAPWSMACRLPSPAKARPLASRNMASPSLAEAHVPVPLAAGQAPRFRLRRGVERDQRAASLRACRARHRRSPRLARPPGQSSTAPPRLRPRPGPGPSTQPARRNRQPGRARNAGTAGARRRRAYAAYRYFPTARAAGTADPSDIRRPGSRRRRSGTAAGQTRPGCDRHQ